MATPVPRRRPPGARGPARPAARALPLLLAAGLALTPRAASAHAVGLSRGDYTLAGDHLVAELTFARAELATALPALDPDHDGEISPTEIAAAPALLEREVLAPLAVTSPAGACPGHLDRVEPADQDGLTLRATFTCPGRPARVHLALGFVDHLSHGHRHLATATADGALAHAVIFAGATTLDLEVPKAGAAGGTSVWSTAWSLLQLGVEHILTGYDHLLFLFGLILVGGRLRQLALVITAFTVAHSITLGLAALDVYSPSPAFVEPAIALSIAYVGVENWFVKDARRRWMITFPFGLIHGFGFAGALREIALPHDQVPVALAAFNAGVELGQLAVLLVMMPALLWLRRQPWFGGLGLKVVSGAVACAGVFWFIERVA